MRRRGISKRGGFTLVEVLVAGTILAIAAAVLGTAVSRSLESLQVSGDFDKAAGLLDRTLTKVDMIGPDRLLREGPLRGWFQPPDDRFAWELDIGPRVEGHLYEITARITWQADRAQRSVEVQTLLNDPPNVRNPELQWSDL